MPGRSQSPGEGNSECSHVKHVCVCMHLCVGCAWICVCVVFTTAAAFKLLVTLLPQCSNTFLTVSNQRNCFVSFLFFCSLFNTFSVHSYHHRSTTDSECGNGKRRLPNQTNPNRLTNQNQSNLPPFSATACSVLEIIPFSSSHHHHHHILLLCSIINTRQTRRDDIRKNTAKKTSNQNQTNCHLN